MNETFKVASVLKYNGHTELIPLWIATFPNKVSERYISRAIRAAEGKTYAVWMLGASLPFRFW